MEPGRGLAVADRDVDGDGDGDGDPGGSDAACDDPGAGVEEFGRVTVSAVARGRLTAMSTVAAVTTSTSPTEATTHP